MTPNDLYSECAPTRHKRKPTEHMRFPLVQWKPNRFLEPVAAVHWRAGNRHMVSTNKAKNLLRRLGL